ncbi:MAG: UDP-N-acetylmuramoyl-tripeptide--D-alanyl-D-alanine ligase [Limnohabitans sp.]
MSGMQLTLAQAMQALPQARLQAAADPSALRIQRVHTDTRTLQPGDLFVALRGERFDANAFIAQAAAQGAVAVLCEPAGADAAAAAGCPALLVPDTRAALGQLAAHWRQGFAGPLIAVTGSNGKTTVTQMLASILRAHAGEQALATEGNFNNDIGVPLTLLRLRPEHRIAVLELGMNHPGEIAQLAAWAQPTVALVNNAQREHQEFMGSVEAVAQENGAVLQALPAHGVAVFPQDETHTPVWQALAGARRVIGFGAAGSAPVWADALQWVGDHWCFDLHTPQGQWGQRLHIAGRHNVRNALAACAAALGAGVPVAAIEAGLTAFAPVRGRSRALRLGAHRTLVDDTYNANPDSVRAAIDVLAELPGPRLLVLGDMGEVGAQGPQYHTEVGAYAQARGVEALWGLGELAAHAVAAHPAGVHHPDAAALLQRVQDGALAYASVLVKGSRFMKMERIVQALLDAQGEPHVA